MNDSIEIRLTGENVKPGLVRSHELAEIMESIEDLVIHETLRSNPNLKREDIIVGLYEIGDASIGLRFKATLAAFVIPAFTSASVALSNGEFDKLAPQSLKALEKISQFSKRHNSVTEFKVVGDLNPIAEINSSTEIPKESMISGVTEIAAKVLRVGGKQPRAMLELLDGNVLYCTIPVDIAINLGHRLYETVVLTGNALWSASSMKLEEFSISSFRPFPRKDPLKTLFELGSVIGGNLANIDDPVSFFSSIRQGEDF